MATAMDNDSSRETLRNETSGMSFGSTTSKKKEMDEVPDYNEAFPQLIPAGQTNVNRAHTFFPSSAFPLASNGNTSTGAMASTTTSAYTTNKTDEDRRRKMAIHASSATTKIVSFVFFLFYFN